MKDGEDGDENDQMDVWRFLRDKTVQHTTVSKNRCADNGVPALGIRWMSLPAMRPNILSLKHVKWLGKRQLRCKSCATKKSK